MKRLTDIIRNTRSYRRFYQNHHIPRSVLLELIDLSRFAGSARNLQPLKYKVVNQPQLCARIFPHLVWAGYLQDWPGPVEGERPSAYILCLLNTKIAKNADCDIGIATQNILLGATEQGLGGCRIGSISPSLRKILAIPQQFDIKLILALGKPREQVVLVEAQSDTDIQYWRDDKQIHYVPKRPLSTIILA